MARMTLDQLLRANIVSGDIWQPLTQKLGVPGWEYQAEAVNEGGNATGTGIADPNKLGRLQGYTFDWQNTGPENAGTLIAYDPSGNPVGSFDQRDQSAGSAFAEWAALAAAGFGGAALAGFGGPLGGLLGGAGGAGQVGSSVAGVGGEAAANLAAYGGTLTPAQVAATAGFDLGAAGGFGAGGLGATGAITGGAGLVAPTVGAGAGVGAGLGSTGAAGAAGAAGSAAGSAGFWTGALKTVAPVLGSVAGGLIQSNAAGKAANAQTAAARAGMEAIQKALAPYQQAGAQAIGGQQDLLGLNGPAKQQAAIDAIRMSPAFTSQQQLGENRILANASATGGLRGGNVQGALAQFSPALLSSLIDQQYTRLGGLTTVGANAAAGVGSATANLQGQIGSAQAGQALANGQALTGVLGSGLNAFGQYLGSQPTAGIAPAITTNTPFGQFQLGGGF